MVTPLPSNPSDTRAYFEQRMFVLSPLNAFWTVVVLFIAVFGSYLLLALGGHVPLYSAGPHGAVIAPHTRIAFSLAVVMCCALFIQRYTRMKERLDRDAFAAVLKPGALERRDLVALTPRNAKLVWPTVIGLVLGVVVSWPLYGTDMMLQPNPPYGVFAWFVVVNTALVTAFTRGVELSRTGSKASAEAIDHELIVDLLRIDTLAVWGRSAARFALIWFTVSAVSCLFFVGQGLNPFTVSMLATFLALGIYVFVRPMERVHRKIRDAKAAELERVRGDIDKLHLAASTNADAATRLQGLLAYETRIAAAPEWPFDQTTLVRVGASALILTVPWFGQAIAQFVIERMGHFSG